MSNIRLVTKMLRVYISARSQA